MQVFLPYSDLSRVACSLYCDKRRYNKQIIECKQILAAINGTSKAWKNHPIVAQYRPYAKWLELYMKVLEWYRIGGNKYLRQKFENDKFINELRELEPPFIYDQEYLNNHKKRLFQKNPLKFPEFILHDDKDCSNLYCVPLDYKVPTHKNVEVIRECEKYKVVKYKQPKISK